MTTSWWRPSGRNAPLAALLLAAITTIPAAAQPAARRWLVDNSAPAAAGAVATIAQAVESAAPGDTIAVRASARPYAGGFALKGGQTLVGEGGSAVIAADSDVIRVADAARDVVIANVTVRAGATAAGVVVQNTKGAVTLRDVLVSTAGGIGVSVKSAAKLIVSGSSSVASVDAPAISIEDAALDAAFSTVSARGKMASGVVLRRTTGSFNVAGKRGQRGSGGTIDGATERAISVANATNVAFRWMTLVRGARANGVAPGECGGNLLTGSNERCNAPVVLAGVNGATLEGLLVDGSAQAGVVAHDVRNFSLVDSEIRGAGDELNEHGVLLQELRGDCRITGTKISRSASRHLMLHNSDGSLTLTIDRSSFTDNPAPNGQQAVLISAAKSASLDVHVRECAFVRSFSNALDVTATDEAKVQLEVSKSTFEGNASAITVSSTGRAVVRYEIADNPSITGSNNAAINAYLGQPSLGSLTGSILRNTIGRSGAPKSGAECASCSGIALTAAGNGMLTTEVTGNVVQQVGGNALAAVAGQGGAQMRLTVASNLFREPAGNAAAIRIVSGTAASDVTSVCADIGGPGVRANTIEGAWSSEGAIHLMHRFGGTQFRVAGLGDDKSDAGAASAVGARNRGAKVRAVLRPESQARGFEPAERCTIQALSR